MAMLRQLTDKKVNRGAFDSLPGSGISKKSEGLSCSPDEEQKRGHCVDSPNPIVANR